MGFRASFPDHYLEVVLFVTVRVTARMLAARDHFVTCGYAAKGAAAIVGNGCGESGLDLDSTFDRPHADHGSGGFLEWRDSPGARRKTELAAFADAIGPGCRDELFTQCDYAIWELGKYFPALDQQLRSPGERSIANLTANFCWQFENPAPATAGLDQRIACAEAVAARAAEIHGADAPRPALPAPVPRLPRSPPPLPDLPPSQAPARAPVPAPAPARRAAVRDGIEAMREALLAEHASIEEEIAILDTTEKEFAKLDAIAAPALQASAASPAAISPIRSLPMPVNIWTSMFGTGGILAAAFAVFTSIKNGQTPDAEQVAMLLGVISAGIGLIKAKDANVTGGTVPATAEAKRRVDHA